jgi:hypothetical protein
MRTIGALIACVGLLVSVADSLGPQNSRTLLNDDDTVTEQLVVWQQCGDKAGLWAGKSCMTGACVRVNEWYMQCIPDEDPTSSLQRIHNVLQPWEPCNAASNPKVSSSSHQALLQVLPAAATFMLHAGITRCLYQQHMYVILGPLSTAQLSLPCCHCNLRYISGMHEHASGMLAASTYLLQNHIKVPPPCLLTSYRRSALKGTLVYGSTSGTPSAGQRRQK